MARLTTGSVARDLATLFASGTLANASDGALLEQYVTQGDESCFRELVARHGPLLLALCRRSLDDPRDVEDAFQAIFLTLVRKARSLRDQEALSSWLFGVALRVVRRARKNAQQRRLRERPMAGEPAVREEVARRVDSREIRAIIDQEIDRLPPNQQLAVMLCLLEGHTHEVAATRLGWPLGTPPGSASRLMGKALCSFAAIGKASSGPTASWTSNFLASARSLGPTVSRGSYDASSQSRMPKSGTSRSPLTAR